VRRQPNGCGFCVMRLDACGPTTPHACGRCTTIGVTPNSATFLHRTQAVVLTSWGCSASHVQVHQHVAPQHRSSSSRSTHLQHTTPRRYDTTRHSIGCPSRYSPLYNQTKGSVHAYSNRVRGQQEKGSTEAAPKRQLYWMQQQRRC